MAAARNEAAVTLKVTWVSRGRKAENPPDPEYPNGRRLDVSKGQRPSCQAQLPYPAPECGQHVIKCDGCGNATVVTAAGRVDDPRSIRIACKWMPPKGSKLQ